MHAFFHRSAKSCLKNAFWVHLFRLNDIEMLSAMRDIMTLLQPESRGWTAMHLLGLHREPSCGRVAAMAFKKGCAVVESVVDGEPCWSPHRGPHQAIAISSQKGGWTLKSFHQTCSNDANRLALFCSLGRRACLSPKQAERPQPRSTLGHFKRRGRFGTAP